MDHLALQKKMTRLWIILFSIVNRNLTLFHLLSTHEAYEVQTLGTFFFLDFGRQI